MDRRDDLDRPDAWRRFLEAEAGGRPEAELEAALGALFGELDRPAPRPGFAARVLVRVRRRPLFARPAVQLALAAALVAVAIGTALFVPAVAPLVALLAPAQLLGAAAEAITAVAGRFAAGAALWQEAGLTAQALGRALLHPVVLALVFVQFAVVATGLKALTGLAGGTRRGLRHVVP
jgi:hypothetical protein